MEEMTGVVIKDYRVLERFDSAGFVAMYFAEHQVIKTKVIIRILHPRLAHNELAIRRYFEAAIAAGQVKHSGVAQIYDVGVLDGRPYLIQEHLEGETLDQRIRDRGRLPISDVVHIGQQTVSVIRAMREAGVVHRDLKPANIFLAQDPAFARRERVKISNFHCAKNEHLPDPIEPDATVGTPPYMSPEQWNNAGQVSTATDIYALGCIVFEMCCGQRPFQAATITDYVEVHGNHVPSRVRDLRPDVPLALDNLVAAMLAKTPSDRPSLEALAQCFAACPAAP